MKKKRNNKQIMIKFKLKFKIKSNKQLIKNKK